MRDEGFERSFEQGNRTMDIVQDILWRAFIEVADKDRDMHENTDLVLKTPYGDVEISVRVRAFKWFKDDYKYEFTLCCHRNSGADAEWQKIFGTCKDGKEHGHYIFYGFENEAGDGIIWWFIGEFDAFRNWWRSGKVYFKHKSDTDKYIGDIMRGGEKIGACIPVTRHDRQTGETYYDHMNVFDRRIIPDFVIASSEEVNL